MYASSCQCAQKTEQNHSLQHSHLNPMLLFTVRALSAMGAGSPSMLLFYPNNEAFISIRSLTEKAHVACPEPGILVPGPFAQGARGSHSSEAELNSSEPHTSTPISQSEELSELSVSQESQELFAKVSNTSSMSVWFGSLAKL